MADDACTERTSGQADGRTGADDAVGRTSGRADGAERPRTVGRTGVERVQTVERTVEWTGGRGPRGADTRTGERGADGAQHARTGGRVDRESGGQADGRMGGWADWGGRADGRTSGWARV